MFFNFDPISWHVTHCINLYSLMKCNRQHICQFNYKSKQNNSITDISIGSGPPMSVEDFSLGTVYRLPHQSKQEGNSAEMKIIDKNYLPLYEISLIAGRNIDNNEKKFNEFIVNEKLSKSMGWTPEEALGQKVEANLGNSIIVGVCDDFHFTSLKQEIGNYGFHNKNTEWLQYLLVKLDASNLSANLAALQETFETISPTTVFEYTFLDDQVAQLYQSEQSLAKLVFSFATLAIIIACLGLFALAAYATELRTKEIGIRKVLGAPVSRIVSLLSKDFLILVLIGFGIAIPVAWYTMHNWLLDFSYRIDIQWWVFALAGLLAALIAFLTVSTQSIKAAMANPIDALRSE